MQHNTFFLLNLSNRQNSFNHNSQEIDITCELSNIEINDTQPEINEIEINDKQPEIINIEIHDTQPEINEIEIHDTQPEITNIEINDKQPEITDIEINDTLREITNIEINEIEINDTQREITDIEIHDTSNTIVEVINTSFIIQNHINYNFYDLQNSIEQLYEHSDELYFSLKKVNNDTILYKHYECISGPAELKDLNPLVHDNVAAYAVSGIYYFNKNNNIGYLLNLNYINNEWYVNQLYNNPKENEINLYINNGIYYILKTISNFESYLVKVEIVKQLLNNKMIYKNKLYEIDINGSVIQSAIL